MAELAEPDDALGMAMILEGALMEFNDSITMETK